jgi:hypothetical protein
MTIRLAAAAALLLGGAGPAVSEDLDRPPIRYTDTAPDTAVTRLEQRLKAKKLELTHDDEHGYLPAVLKALEVPLSSQVLVFSKTSLQRGRIGPKTPRALYFNDEVAVGFCRNGDVLEVTASDPDLGTVYYTVEQRADRTPRFTRQTESCLICHGSSSNQGYPGHLVRSVSPDAHGELVLSRGSKRVDHTTPFEDRWGGWYVTGTSGKQSHLGNQIVGGWSWAEDDKQPDPSNVTDLRPYFTVANYPTPHSDLVALMVLEHQGEGYNRITRAGMRVRQALHEQAALNKATGEPADKRRESITRRIEWACEPVVQYLLFSEEAKLTGPVRGTSDFAKEFAARGPFDSQKRSLREFDLKTRMFRYPMSYLVYSRQFDGLPAEAKDRIYLRLFEVLTGKDESKPFAHLTRGDRTAVLEILRETKPDLPGNWKK